jgi:hypothetical protein
MQRGAPTHSPLDSETDKLSKLHWGNHMTEMTDSRSALFFFGAFGGIMPTLANLATTYVAIPDTPMPAWGLVFGLALFALIGGGVALTNTSREVRQAIFAGIAAPAIMTSVIAGSTEGGGRRKAEFISAAHAQTQPQTDSSSSVKMIYFSPSVTGGANLAGEIPVTARVQRAGKLENITLGEIRTLEASSAISVPAGIDEVFVMGNPVKVSGPVTQSWLNVTTRPTVLGDFWWSMGGQRKFTVQDLTVSTQPFSPEMLKPKSELPSPFLPKQP